MDSSTAFLRFETGVESPAPDEQQHLDEIVATMRSISEHLGERYRHGVRSVHSKSHGILAGTLEVRAGLPAPYAQGIFATPGRYDVIIRMSTNPGDLLPDDVSTPRGCAMKIIGPEGQPMVEGHAGERTQDILMVNGPVLGAPGPREFAAQIKLLASHLGDPVELKEAISAVARTAEKGLEAIGKPSPLVSSLGGQAPTNILGETFNSQLATRHGDYIAKYSLRPESENVRALAGTELDLKNPDCIRDAVVSFFEKESGTWELSAQLCTDLETMPVEDGATPWPEDRSPFVAIGRVTLGVQPAYSPEHRVYGDDVLSFNPWHAFEAHRPLGAHNRVRRVAYPMSADYRRDANVRTKREPRDASEFFAI